LVVFDCDGVLVDSERLTVEVEVRYLAEIGWPLSADEVVTRFLGRTEDAMIKAIEDHIGRPAPAEWRARWLAETQTLLDAELEPVDGVGEAIVELLQSGLSVCVGSSGRPEKIRRNLRTAGLLHHFKSAPEATADQRSLALFSALEVPRGKPEPDLFLLAASTMGFAPAACVVVEDSRYGVAAARAAGMAVVGYAGGLTAAGDLAAADRVIDDMAGLPKAVRDLLDREASP
jgi:beta-phosphoglucomutase-like phosphatase (HAD superfamily)